MNRLLRLTLVVLCWAPLDGANASLRAALAPAAIDNPDRNQTPGTPATATPAGAPSQSWKSCAERLSAPGELSTSLKAQFERPQDISQMLQNLKLAWENDWLLRPDFYDDETLLKFFNGAAITWKQRPNSQFPAEEIAMETDSRVFPRMSIALEAYCRSRSFPRPNGREKTILSVGGNFRIYGPPVPELTLANLRQALGPETRNQLDLEFAGGSELADPPAPTNKGSVVYTDPVKQKREGQRIGLTFYFSIPPKPTEPFQPKIAADDVVLGIVLSDGRHVTSEN
jgi:hypothetical protein